MAPKGTQALQQQAGTQSTKRRLLDGLKLCGSTKNLQWGKEIHAEAVESGHDSCIYFATALVKMYAKCGSMAEARQVFDAIKQPDVVSWNALILGYAENGEGVTALLLFSRMKHQGRAPNCVTFVAALKACTALALDQNESTRAACLERGKEIHAQVGCHLDVYVQTTLINMYAKCGSMEDARQAFESIRHPTVVSWNALLLGYAENGEGVTAMNLFEKMRFQGCVPNSLTFVAALKACTSLADAGQGSGSLQHGKRIHAQIGGRLDLFVQSALIDMYAKCGSMTDAQQVFDSVKHPNVVVWNTLILGYAESGKGHTALDELTKMKSRGCQPNSLTFLAALKACTSLASSSGETDCLARGREFHAQIGRHPDIYLQNSLVHMYARCGSMVEARQVFDSIKHPTMVSWNALISGYAENGEGVTALDLFARMRTQGFEPNFLTFVAALKACGLLGALSSGRKIHAEVTAELDVILVTTLVDFYSKCASMGEAQQVFNAHPRTKNLITWNALLTGYARLGDTNAVFGLYEALQDAGFRPDGVTFLCIFTCCSHSGLVDKAKELFQAMRSQHGIAATLEHYSCMVDILGRSNELHEAIALLRGMPCSPDVVTWASVLCTSRKWRNAETGKLAFESVVALDASNAAAYVLMAHIYGNRGMWKQQETVLAMRRRLA